MENSIYILPSASLPTEVGLPKCSETTIYLLLTLLGPSKGVKQLLAFTLFGFLDPYIQPSHDVKSAVEGNKG